MEGSAGSFFRGDGAAVDSSEILTFCVTAKSASVPASLPSSCFRFLGGIAAVVWEITGVTLVVKIGDRAREPDSVVNAILRLRLAANYE